MPCYKRAIIREPHNSPQRFSYAPHPALPSPPAVVVEVLPSSSGHEMYLGLASESLDFHLVGIKFQTFINPVLDTHDSSGDQGNLGVL